ncbi:MAG: cell division protein FtsZ [Anaerolineaceae bacterium]|nr:cell division protein FtsZ [Anaerolineaceae bacterium]
MTLITDTNTIHHTPIAAKPPVLKVVGVGGGGCNAVNRMIELGIGGVDFIVANTDAQALSACLASVKLQLGPHCTRGLGAGGQPEVGQLAAEESVRTIADALSGADMVFVAAGMGGGTGTGAAPVIARIARNTGAVTIAIVTMPFGFEAGRRQVNARQGVDKLRPYTDTLISIPNDKLIEVGSRDLTLDMAFRLADDVLRQGVQSISELVNETGLINVDFAHLKRLMQQGGGSYMSIGYGQGPEKARQAVDQALQHPLLESIPIESATGIIANFSGDSSLSFYEVAEAMTYMQERTGHQAEIIPGLMTDDRLVDRTQVILIITGLGGRSVSQSAPLPMPESVKPIPAQNTVQLNKSVFIQDHTTAQDRSNALTNLDMPAFIRKRYRTNG